MKQDGQSSQMHGTRPNSPHAGKPLDGSQYVDVVEEQLYSERRPSIDAKEPRPEPPKPVRRPG